MLNYREIQIPIEYRDKCDTVQENTCSTGLHIGGRGWLKKNYYGNTGLACLINPADVVAVP